MNGLNITQIKELLPQRYPFLMIDRVLEIIPGEKVIALKNISANEAFFQGHFPDYMVMPGALILEGIAQTAIILYAFDKKDEDESEKVFLFGSVKARFKNPAYPGDQMIIEVTPVKIISTGGIVKGIAKVGDRLVCKAELSFSVQTKGT
jgi:3-hydroxyacyl-[acyl-carrier-protein] dehydratase